MLDCIVVGAGPGGGSAAYHLSKRGRSVLVLEKDAFPRSKSCGGGVSPQIAQWFDFDFSPIVSQKVDQIRFTWKFEDPVEAVIDTPEPMWMVDRAAFDQYVMEQAVQQGATFQTETPVTGIEFQKSAGCWTVKTAQETFQAKYLVAADGGQGPMSRWLGFKPLKAHATLSLDLPQEQTPEQAHLSHFEFGLMKGVCLWNFPKAAGRTLCGVAMVGGEPRQFAEKIKEYSRFFDLDPEQGQLQSGTVCLWESNRPLHTQQAVLVGETAGVVDPFSGEGIRPSMLSGLRAAEAIDAALGGEDNALAQYSQQMQDEWGSDMVWAQRIAGLFYRVPGFGYQIGVKRPSARARMGKILCGEIRYSDVATRAIKLLSSKFIPGLGS
ncbi:MAG: NAD(P)/FAD-dependent oxidoreductase [Prochlorotrichaceae cyanobacterium]